MSLYGDGSFGSKARPSPVTDFPLPDWICHKGGAIFDFGFRNNCWTSIPILLEKDLSLRRLRPKPNFCWMDRPDKRLIARQGSQVCVGKACCAGMRGSSFLRHSRQPRFKDWRPKNSLEPKRCSVAFQTVYWVTNTFHTDKHNVI